MKTHAKHSAQQSADTAPARQTRSLDGWPPLHLDDLYSLDELIEEFPSLLTKSTLRWQLRDRDTNGMAPAVVRIGRKLRICKARYQHWIAHCAGGQE